MTIKRLGLLAVTLLLACAPALADDLSLNAVGAGSCDNAQGTGTCTTSDFVSFGNHDALEGVRRDFFSFDLASLNGLTILSAEVRIFNPGQGGSFPVDGDNDPFTLSHATSLDYDGLLGATPYGSTSTFGTNQYVTISLNADGIAALIANEGLIFTFGGDLTNSSQDLFRFTTVNPFAVLDVHTMDNSDTPEPASMVLFASGLLGAAGTLRRKFVA